MKLSKRVLSHRLGHGIMVFAMIFSLTALVGCADGLLGTQEPATQTEQVLNENGLTSSQQEGLDNSDLSDEKKGELRALMAKHNVEGCPHGDDGADHNLKWEAFIEHGQEWHSELFTPEVIAKIVPQEDANPSKPKYRLNGNGGDCCIYPDVEDNRP